jgi:hypothetical protein
MAEGSNEYYSSVSFLITILKNGVLLILRLSVIHAGPENIRYS